MKYILVFALCLFPFQLFAEENLIPEASNVIHVSEYIEQEDIIDPNIPACNDADLIKEIKKEVIQYLEKQNQGSIIEKRNHNLVLKYLDNYSEKDVENFNNQENYQVADTIIMLKLNQHVSAQNMRLCVTEGKKPVYVLIYPEDFRYHIEIINLVRNGNPKDNLSFLYTPEVKQYENFED
ncbi:MAG: hypothetical protein J6Y53_01240 [Alphaproteobacteria bacterium]|nr:hypothetical protein [Alphaproteobacteria bacterium]